MLTAESSVPELRSFEVEIAIEKLKGCTCKSPDTDRSPAELIHAEGNILSSENHKLVHFIWNKEQLL